MPWSLVYRNSRPQKGGLSQTSQHFPFPKWRSIKFAGTIVPNTGAALGACMRTHATLRIWAMATVDRSAGGCASDSLLSVGGLLLRGPVHASVRAIAYTWISPGPIPACTVAAKGQRADANTTVHGTVERSDVPLPYFLCALRFPLLGYLEEQLGLPGCVKTLVVLLLEVYQHTFRMTKK